MKLLKIIMKIYKNQILDKLKIKEKEYFLVTLHRQENVDSKEKLKILVKILETLSNKFKKSVVWPLHPRTFKI